MMPLEALALSQLAFTFADITLNKTSYKAKSHINGAGKYTLVTLGECIENKNPTHTDVIYMFLYERHHAYLVHF